MTQTGLLSLELLNWMIDIPELTLSRPPLKGLLDFEREWCNCVVSVLLTRKPKEPEEIAMAFHAKIYLSRAVFRQTAQLCHFAMNELRRSSRFWSNLCSEPELFIGETEQSIVVYTEVAPLNAEFGYVRAFDSDDNDERNE